MSGARDLLGLLVFFGTCFGAAALGGALTGPGFPEWYGTLNKPGWTAPPWVFGPVWTLLFAAMALAAWRVWHKGGRGTRLALALFFLQLVLNVAWPALFFALHRPDWALADAVALWLAVLLTLLAFARISARAASLLVPYLVWVGYAVALNHAIWRMN